MPVPHLMVKFPLLFLAVLLSCSYLKGQYSVINSSIGVGANIVSPDHVPFWLRSNQFGNIPPPGNSVSFYGSFHKDYDTIENPLIDWGGSLEVRANIGNQVQGIQGNIIEGYLKMAISVFQIKAGRDKQVMGLMDTTLSSGSFAMSGNALGIPKVEISVPQYYTIPIFDELFAVKGTLSLGWMGAVPIQYQYIGYLNTYLHQASFYGRFGKPDWQLHLYGGFNHQVQYGNEDKVWGKQYDLNGWQTFIRVITGKTWNYSKIGNQIGSIDLGLQYDFNTVSLFIYRQNFYDEGALVHLANIADGLNGISFTNTGDKNGFIHWNKFLIEFFYSANQAGYPWSKPTKSGDENYYNNYEYADGYSYKGVAIGSPLISSKYDTRPFPNSKFDYFNNNRVSALHVGLDATIQDFHIITKATYSKNYGTFSTSPYGSSTGTIRDKPVGSFPESNQFSCYLQIEKPLSDSYSLNISMALDHGLLLYNTSGISFQIMKSF